MSQSGKKLLNEYIVSLSEIERRHDKLKRFFSNWKMIAIVAISLYTAKIASEQLAMIFRNQLIEVARGR